VIVAAIALSTAPRIARVARGAALPIVERDFIAGSEAMGVPRWRIVSGELLPNTLGPLMVEASLRLTYSIAVIAALAFLGLSANPNSANWGTMINENQIVLAVQPWGALAPIIAIALLTLGTGLVGDGIARTAAGIDRARGEERARRSWRGRRPSLPCPRSPCGTCRSRSKPPAHRSSAT